MKSLRARTRSLIGAGVAMVLFMGSAGSALALGQRTWNDCWGGYTGKSWQSPINGALHAQTLRSGGTCAYVYVAWNDYGSLRRNTGRSSSGTYIAITYSTANYPTGATHKSRPNSGLVLT